MWLAVQVAGAGFNPGPVWQMAEERRRNAERDERMRNAEAACKAVQADLLKAQEVQMQLAAELDEANRERSGPA
jgi:hypothetical protein